MYTEDSTMACEECQNVENDNEVDFHVDLYDLDNKAPTLCICPKCGKEHKLKIFWTGRGTPKMYCHRCREQIATICDGAIYESQPDAFRVIKGGISCSE